MYTDVLVIGGGLAGLRCAEEAAKNCKVTLIANGSGASPYIHGINIPLHPEDSVDLFIDDTLKSGRGLGNYNLVRKLCEESVFLTEEFEFDKNESGEYDLLKPLGSSVPRVAGISGRTGVHIINEIKKESSFEILKNVRAMKLAVDKNKVLGAYCYNTVEKNWFFIGAKAVVLATGGFGGIFSFSTNSSDIGGDGIAMAFDAGAELCDMEFIQFEPTAAVSPLQIKGKSIITTMLYEGAVILNSKNERFMEERVNKDELSLGIYREIQKGNGTTNNGVFFDMRKVPEELLLTKYKDYFQRYKNCGIDIREVAVEISPAPHTTLGGVKTDENCKTTVRGLFACGEVMGGLHGANRLGGNAGLEVLVFGKIAGKSAAEFALQNKDETCELIFEFNEEEISCEEMRIKLTKAIEKGLNVIRCKEDLDELHKVSQEVMAFAEKNGKSFCVQRLYNDALTACICACSALERKGNIGCHNRIDSVEESEKYTVRAYKKDNKILVEKGI